MEIRKKDKSNLFLFGATILLLLLDQITKLAVKGFDFLGLSVKGIEFGEKISIIGDFLQFTYVENPGMAFGISFGAAKIFLSLFSLIASIALVWYLLKITKFNVWVRIGVALVLAGAAGNLIDRLFYGIIFNEGPLFYGRVVDFIQVDIPDIRLMGRYWTHWPVFNIADACVTVGVVILLFVHKEIPGLSRIKNIDSSPYGIQNEAEDEPKRG